MMESSWLLLERREREKSVTNATRGRERGSPVDGGSLDVSGKRKVEVADVYVFFCNF